MGVQPWFYFNDHSNFIFDQNKPQLYSTIDKSTFWLSAGMGYQTVQKLWLE